MNDEMTATEILERWRLLGERIALRMAAVMARPRITTELVESVVDRYAPCDVEPSSEVEP